MDNAGKLGVSLDKAALLKHRLLPQLSILAKYLFLGFVSLKFAVNPRLLEASCLPYLRNPKRFHLSSAPTSLPIGARRDNLGSYWSKTAFQSP